MLEFACLFTNAIEFKGQYDGKVVCKKEPDGPTVCGLFLSNFVWLTAPKKISIGKGFYVEPDLPYGIQVWGAQSSLDLELIVTGPGLPQNGKRVSFKWGLSPCFGASQNTYCKQFFNTEVVTSSWYASDYLIQFISGYTQQSIHQNLNTGTWFICYDGPFETVTMTPLPIYDVIWIPHWGFGLVSNLKDVSLKEKAALPDSMAIEGLEDAIKTLARVHLPTDKTPLRDSAIKNFEQGLDEVKHASMAMDKSNDYGSEQERTNLRAKAIERLETAYNLFKSAVEVIVRLDRELKSKAQYIP